MISVALALSVTCHAYDQLRTPSLPPHLQHPSPTRPLTPYLLSFIRTPDLIPLPPPSACIRSFASARLYPYYVITRFPSDLLYAVH